MPRGGTAKGGGHRLSERELEVLRTYVEVEADNRVYITKTLDPALYERIKLLFERLGGSYLPNRKRFEFPLDPSPLFSQTIALGVMPQQNPLDFYYSPPPVVEEVLCQLEWCDAMRDLLWHCEQRGRSPRMLESSAGLGHLVDGFRTRYPAATIEVCELDPYRRAVLQAKGYHVVADDFLRYRPPPDQPYDVILLNPPFTVAGNVFTFLRHIEHAEQMLADNRWSRLVSVVPAQFSRLERYRDFHIHVLKYGSFELLPQGSFVEAGTSWETAVVTLSREQNHFYAHWDDADPEDGHVNQRQKVAWMYISADTPLVQARQSLLREMVEGKLTVYRSGRLAPETRSRIHGFCQQVTERLLYEYHVYVPFTPEDVRSMERHFVADYAEACAQYGAEKRSEWELDKSRSHRRLQERVKRNQALLERNRRLIADLERDQARYAGELEEFERASATPPEFSPAAQPPDPEDPAGALPALPKQTPPRSEREAHERKRPAHRRYRQLAFF